MSSTASATPERKPPRLALVTPCFNEEEILPRTLAALTDKLQQLTAAGSISADSFCLVVDDGSRDQSWSLIEAASRSEPQIEGLKLVANVGHQSALFAGLEAVAESCDCCISIDADLQDDLAAIDEMLALYQQGHPIVLGVRANRDSDTWFKRETANVYYRIARLLGVDLVAHHADFRLLSRQALQNLVQYGEQNLFLRAIPSALGSNLKTVEYRRLDRTAGQSKYPLLKMLGLAWTGISSFSVWPLRLITITGLMSALLSLLLGLVAVAQWLFGMTVPGWTSIILVMVFFFSLILISLSIIGEYLAKIYLEVVARPRYFIEKDTR